MGVRRWLLNTPVRGWFFLSLQRKMLRFWRTKSFVAPKLLEDGDSSARADSCPSVAHPWRTDILVRHPPTSGGRTFLSVRPPTSGGRTVLSVRPPTSGGRTFLSVRSCGKYAGQECPASRVKFCVPPAVPKELKAWTSYVILFMLVSMLA